MNVTDLERRPSMFNIGMVEVEGEKVYFFEPLERVISIKELQKIMDTAEEVVNKLKEGK
jgi:hypothetical protein